jgi:hypothetical protein
VISVSFCIRILLRLVGRMGSKNVFNGNRARRSGPRPTRGWPLWR